MTRRTLLLASLTLAQPQARAAQQAPVNYSAGVVRATGSGAPPTASQNPAQARLMAIGAAKADALRNLAMAVSSIQVTATTKVKNYVTESDIVETKVSALLQNARIVAETVGKDGTASVTVEIPLYGPRSVASAVLAEVILDPRDLHANAPAPSNPPAPRPEVRPEPRPEPNRRPRRPMPPMPERPITPNKGLPIPPRPGFTEPSGGAKPLPPEPRSPRPTPRDLPLRLTPSSESGPFTALIVDCRGLGIQAVMSPKLYDASGHEIYGTLRVDIDYAIEVGIVGYPRSVEEALTGKRAGNRPLIVRALRAKDSYKIDVVLSNDDAQRVIQADQQAHFLEKCRVILLCDPVR